MPHAFARLARRFAGSSARPEAGVRLHPKLVPHAADTSPVHADYGEGVVRRGSQVSAGLGRFSFCWIRGSSSDMADQSSVAIIRFNQRTYASGGVAAVVKDHGMAERIVTEFDAN